ncbi:MAG TPA: outer membrane beta-barrel protein [Chitinophagaceae bacterium]|nr:outer membrane beta-barrel protein [Chitinophagaceae bacterium]
MLLIFPFINFFPANAQSRIHGKITDTTGKPIANANVLLLNSNDSVLVKGILTTVTGSYIFENINAGNYLVSATHTGIKPAYSRRFEMSNSNENIDMGIIMLEETSVTLADVTVVAKKPLYEQKIDRLVINVAASITAAGSTALDVLERSPGVIVNRFSNLLSINGKGGVIVMINGKRNYMNMSAVIQMLSGMPSSNIERIEIITTPPANFDADGNAGIINIVLKKNNQFGTNGSYSLMAGYNKGEQNRLSMNMNHRSGKINLFGNYSYSRDRAYQLWSNYHAVTGNGVFMENYSENNRHSLTWQHDVQAGMDYEINKKTIIGGLITGNYRHWSMVADNDALVSKDNSLDTVVDIVNNELHTTRSYGINLNLQHSFKPDEKLSLNFDYLDYYDNNPNDYNNAYSNANNVFAYDEKVKSSKKTPLKFWIGAADYEKKLSKKINMEAGLKGTTSRLTNDVQVATLLQNHWLTDSALSGYHKLKEYIGAAYSSFSITLNEKTSIKAGLRYEYASSVLGTATLKSIVDRHYSNLFPTFFFLHKINDSNSVNFSYSRRIWRPSFADLAPWVIFSDPKTFQTGNPALLPSISDGINVSYTYRNKIVTLSYDYTTNPINNQPALDENINRLVNTVTNSKSFQNFYINLALPFTITKWWSMQNNLSVGWRRSNSFYKENIKQDFVGFYVYGTQTFKLPKDISLELSGFYNTGGGWGLYTFSSLGSLDFGAQKKFEKKKSTLSLTIRNILNSLHSKQYINLPEQNLVIRTSGVFSYTSFSITYNKRFGKETVKGKRDRSTGAEDERGRAY